MLVQLTAPLLSLSILASLHAPFIAFAEASPSFAPVTAAPFTDAPVTSSPVVPMSDYRCGVDEEDARLNCGQLCTVNTDCETGAFCWGTFPNTCYANSPLASLNPVPSPPIPTHLKPRSDFRCGVSEVDARSNCKSECTTAADCEPGEFCWTTFENYCHMMPDGHPLCDHSESEQIIRRCGYDEQAARSFCGNTCSDELDCTVPGEMCFPVQLNLCECFAKQDEINTPSENIVQRQLDSVHRDETNAEYFERAKEPLARYFTAEDTILDTSTSSASVRTCGFMGLLLIALAFAMI